MGGTIYFLDPFLIRFCHQNGSVLALGFRQPGYIIHHTSHIIMSIQNINNIKSINHYKIKLENEERMAQLCMQGKCGCGTEDRCALKIATEGWHECVEEKRLMTVQEYMELAPTVAEEFVKMWMKDNNGLCSRIMVDSLRAKVAELKASDSLGILTMFTFIIGNPADNSLREDFYEFLEDDDAGHPVTESNFFWEMEKSMKAFADLKRAETAWKGRVTAHAGPNCDQCGNARTGIGGRVCDMCDLAKQDSAILHTTCYCCVDREDEEDYDYDDGNQPPRAIHPGGYPEFADDYDYEGEETDSQAGERRQEMAEENERQMEAEDELNRAVFEHNSTPTEDEHIRIAHNVSPVVPDNWQEIVMRGVK